LNLSTTRSRASSQEASLNCPFSLDPLGGIQSLGPRYSCGDAHPGTIDCGPYNVESDLKSYFMSW
jgi:hypothetical protein